VLDSDGSTSVNSDMEEVLVSELESEEDCKVEDFFVMNLL
jgi:hypothetical protein